MGYRSEVGLAIKKDDVTRLIDTLPGVKSLLDDADEHVKNDEGNHLFIWNDIKWYDIDSGDSSIVKLMKFLSDIDSDEYLFVRLGEESDDMEVNGGWWNNDFNFGYRRELVWN